MHPQAIYIMTLLAIVTLTVTILHQITRHGGRIEEEEFIEMNTMLNDTWKTAVTNNTDKLSQRDRDIVDALHSFDLKQIDTNFIEDVSSKFCGKESRAKVYKDANSLLVFCQNDVNTSGVVFDIVNNRFKGIVSGDNLPDFFVASNISEEENTFFAHV